MNLKDVKITSFRKKYFHDVAALIHDHPAVFSSEDGVSFRKTLMIYRHNHQLLGAKSRVMVLNVGSRVAGCIVFHHMQGSDNYFKVEWLLIGRQFVNKGYGTILFRHAEHIMREEDARYVVLETSNEKRNHYAVHFYQSQGFQKTAVFPNFYAHPIRGRKSPEDCVVFWKKL